MEDPAPPPKYTSSKGMWVTKLILRIISLIFCITLAALLGAMANTHIVDVVLFVIMGPPVFLALAWDIAEGICIMVRGGHRGIHPGACVGVDLILWLGLVACTTLLGLLGVGTYRFFLIADYAYDPYTDYDYYDYAYDGIYSDTVNKGRAILGLAGTLTVIHFILFVIACYETNVRNSLPAQTTYVVYTTAPAPGGAQTTTTTSIYGAPAGMVQQPQQVYYQQQQPVGGQQQQMPMYYTYAQPQQQQQVPISPVSGSPGATPQSMNIQPVNNMSAPPPVYTGKGPTENKTELP